MTRLRPVPAVWLRCRSRGLMVKSLTKTLEMRGHIDQTGLLICAGTEFTIVLHLEALEWQTNTIETERRGQLTGAETRR